MAFVYHFRADLLPTLCSIISSLPLPRPSQCKYTHDSANI